MTTSNQPPAATLDGDAIASTLMRLVMVSAELGHAEPGFTARDYASKVATLEAQFVRDLFTRSTKEICDRWYGGVANAAAAGAYIRAGQIGSLEEAGVSARPTTEM